VQLAAIGIGIAVVVFAVAMIQASIAVGSDQQLVIFRLGRSDPTLVRGTGRSFLIPILDRGVLVDMRERSHAFPSVPGTTADGRDIEADVHIRCRIVDPYRSVINVASFDGALEAVARTLVRQSATQLTIEPATHTRAIEDAMRGSLEGALSSWGARCVDVVVEAGPARG
jgi:regulator of protease activity HflC (stomatin/prohibitin superfamily)